MCGVAATTTVRHSHQPPPLCALPRPVRCVCAGGGTGHSGALWWHARWCGAVLGAWPPHPPPTLSTLVASLLSPAPKPTLPHTHKWHCSLHTHMACFVCLVPSTHSHTGCLTAHTPSTHTGGCACAHPPALMRHHTHSAGTGVALAWLLWCCGHHHHAPCATHTHRDWWWAPWWWLVVGVWALCGCHATPPTRLACHHTRHIHHHTPWRVVCLARLATPTTTTQPHHTHHNSHCATMVVAIGHHAVHTHPTLATHTPRASTGVAVAFGVAPPPRWCWPFAVFSSSLLVHQPLSLSLLHALTPSSPHQQHHHPIHPLCVVCVLWEWTDGWTTLWLSTPHTALLMGVLIGDTIQPFHPPSPLSLCFCPPPTTTPSLFSAHHHTTHTEEKGRVGMDLLVLWVCDGWCGWHVWFVGGVVCWLCFAWLAHPITLSTPNHHHSPLFLSLHHPTLLSLCLCVEKGVDHKVDGVEWSVVCGMQHISHCAFIKPSPTPVCLSSFTIPFSLSNSFSSSFLPSLFGLFGQKE